MKYKQFFAKIGGWRKSLRTSLRKFLRRSDYKRWGTTRSLNPYWDSRTEQIARLIEPGKSVIEFGAGRLVLQNFLPQNCAYTPSDLISRGPGTLIWDLNSDKFPPLQSFDFAIFSGVLEYVNDVPRLISFLANHINTIVASYAVVEANPDNRRAQGWVNDFSSIHFMEIFYKAGFRCDHCEKWKSQLIYRFRKASSLEPCPKSV